MSLHKEQELKEAVLNLPTKEKDKLLVRLINKDKMLLKQLHYELLEDESDLEDRIIDLKSNLESLFETNANKIKNIPVYSNYKGLSSTLRQASGMVNEHEKITKDKFSVVEARLLILEEAFDLYPSLFGPSALSPAFKLHKYVNGRIKNAVKLFNNLHEDLQFDLREQMEFVLNFAADNKLDYDL
jgi:predicted metal-dependent hydrolase